MNKLNHKFNIIKSQLSKNNRRGDTLIEVIFAFAILGTIIGFSFTGVIQARKSSLAAQQRTQALEIAQYQTQALTAYWANLPWDDGGGGFCPSFKNGGCSGSGNPPIQTGSQTYCLKPTNSSTPQTYWQLTATTSECNSLVPNLSLASGDAPIGIRFSDIGQLSASGPTAGNTNVQATITVSWTDPFGQTASVKTITILTKQK
jgi:type II secretory pathway pseudopilin PulG